MADPLKIPIFKPTKEEAQIILNANKEFMKHYISGILLGLGSAYFLLRSTRTKARSALGFGAYFTLGLTGEYIGRQFGSARALEELKRLPQDSQLAGLLDKMFAPFSKREPIGINDISAPNTTSDTSIPSSSFPRTNEDFSTSKAKAKRKNQYGDDID